MLEKRDLQNRVLALPSLPRSIVMPFVRAAASFSQHRRMGACVQAGSNAILDRWDGRVPLVFVDCGFNSGRVLETFMRELPDDTYFYGFEVQENLRPQAEALKKRWQFHELKLSFAAVADFDGETSYFSSRAVPWGIFPRIATTTCLGREVGPHMDYSDPLPIKAIDFSKWLGRTVADIQTRWGEKPLVAVKMNIEGAEYPALSKVLADGRMGLIDVLMAEFHSTQFSGPNRARFDAQHAAIMDGIKKHNIAYVPWK